MKRCPLCCQAKLLEEFAVNRTRADGRTSFCRPCKLQYERAFYARTPLAAKQVARTAKRRRVKKQNKDLVRAYLSRHPCVDCGEADPIVLDFDHCRGKLANVSDLIHHSSVARVMAEIEKCEVRCANCHRRKTYLERC